jgi:predicted nucleic acid-binding protein
MLWDRPSTHSRDRQGLHSSINLKQSFWIAEKEKLTFYDASKIRSRKRTGLALHKVIDAHDCKIWGKYITSTLVRRATFSMLAWIT